jgi:ElaB/YqjD/DUF883 family membrane-anchored ribosome-binding protein
MRAKAGQAASKIADVAQRTGSHAERTGSQAKQAASSLASEATQKAKGFLNMQVTAGADLVGHVAESARRAADSLDQNAPQLADLVRGAAERAKDFSRDLHQQTVEDLVRTASDFTRRQPALVFGLASLAGFLAFRVFKSTPPRSSADPYRGTRPFPESAGQFYGT